MPRSLPRLFRLLKSQGSLKMEIPTSADQLAWQDFLALGARAEG
jgi:hypothetical protein